MVSLYSPIPGRLNVQSVTGVIFTVPGLRTIKKKKKNYVTWNFAFFHILFAPYILECTVSVCL